jgi:DNA-binding NarL/FixJ family response regulator
MLVNHQHQTLRALCVGRHEFVSEHIGRYFGELGVTTECVVGVENAVAAARDIPPDVILCEYELLTRSPLAVWENDERLSKTAVIGISLSRRPNEAAALDLNGVAGFLYLPTLDAENAKRMISAAAASTRAHYEPTAPATSGSPLAETNSLAQ